MTRARSPAADGWNGEQLVRDLIEASRSDDPRAGALRVIRRWEKRRVWMPAAERAAAVLADLWLDAGRAPGVVTTLLRDKLGTKPRTARGIVRRKALRRSGTSMPLASRSDLDDPSAHARLDAASESPSDMDTNP